VKTFLTFIQKHFIVACLLAIAVGFGYPAPGLALKFLLKPFLLCILFFTALRVDFSMMKGHFKRPVMLGGTVLLLMIILPLLFYWISILVVPEYALGILIMAAMPAGMASTALAVECGGEGALALVVTFLTSLVSPITVPLLVNLSGHSPGGGFGEMARTMLSQSLALAVLLLLPILAGYGVKRAAPNVVKKFQWSYGGLAIISLALLIWIAMSVGAEGVFSNMASSLGLLGWLFVFSATFHIAGYFMMPGLNVRQRTALSANTAYVNNAMAIVFAQTFFKNVEVMLPAILLELPMTVVLIPLKYLAAFAIKRENGGKEDTGGSS